MNILRMADLDLTDKRVLIREDFNVPIHKGAVRSDMRIRAALPTLLALLQQRARVIVISHLGRPQEGHFDPKLSLSPVASKLSELLGKPVPLCSSWLEGVSCDPGSVVLCENVRFNPGEMANDEALARKMAALCDVFVMDAFATAHRAEASTEGVARFAPIACAGTACWWPNSRRSRKPSGTPRVRSSPLSADPKYPRSSACLRPCSTRSTGSFSAAQSPIPSLPP